MDTKILKIFDPEKTKDLMKILCNLAPVTAKCSPFWNIDIDHYLINKGCEYKELAELKYCYYIHKLDSRLLFEQDVVSYQTRDVWDDDDCGTNYEWGTMFQFTIPNKVEDFRTILLTYVKSF